MSQSEKQSSDGVSGAPQIASDAGSTLPPAPTSATWPVDAIGGARASSMFSDMLHLPLDDEDRELAEAALSIDTSADVTVAGPVSTVFDAAPPTDSERATAPLKAPLPGDFGRYRVKGELGRGGMALVVDAVDADLRRRVAMKILKDSRKASTTNRTDQRTPLQRFIEEAQITGQLEHPNIVPVHDIGTDNKGRVYFTMKRVQGQSLRQVFDAMRAGDVATPKRFGVFELCDIFLKVCDAINFAHSRRVVHRDLKPDNIMVGRFGEVQVMDWGLAKVLDRADQPSSSIDTVSGIMTDADAANTIEGTISGTPAYMSPEQALGKVNDIDERTDVFALGALLYELITLVPPFHAKSSKDALRRAQKHELQSPAQAVAELAAREALPDDSHVVQTAIKRARRFPRELAAIAMKALERDPMHRYPGVEDLAADVGRFLKREPVTAYRDPLPKAIAKWAGRHKVVASTGAAVVLVGLVAGLIILVLINESAKTDLANKDVLYQTERDARIKELQASKAEARARELERQENARREAELAAAHRRAEAVAKYSQAADLLNRAATTRDATTAYQTRLNKAYPLAQEAVAIDETFEAGYILLGYLELDLGYYGAAKRHLVTGNRLAEISGRPMDSAAMSSAAMASFTLALMMHHTDKKILFDTKELFRQIRDKAPDGTPYKKVAELQMRRFDAQAKAKKMGPDAYAAENESILRELNELRAGDQQLWEISLFSAMITIQMYFDANDNPEGDSRIHPRGGLTSAREDCRRALEIRPQLPLAVWLLSIMDFDTTLAKAGEAHKTPELIKEGYAAIRKTWKSEYIDRFPFDPMGDFGCGSALLWAMTFYGADEATERVAENSLSKAVELYRDFDHARRRLAVVLMSQARLEEALPEYGHLIQSWEPEPGDSPAPMKEIAFVPEQYISIMLMLDRHDDALGIFTDAERRIRAIPDLHERIYRTTLAAVSSTGDVALVERFLSEHAPPRVVKPALDAARAWGEVGRFDEARRRLKEIRGLSSDSTVLYGVERIWKDTQQIEDFVASRGVPTSETATMRNQVALAACRLLSRVQGAPFDHEIYWSAVVGCTAAAALVGVSTELDVLPTWPSLVEMRGALFFWHKRMRAAVTDEEARSARQRIELMLPAISEQPFMAKKLLHDDQTLRTELAQDFPDFFK